MKKPSWWSGVSESVRGVRRDIQGLMNRELGSVSAGGGHAKLPASETRRRIAALPSSERCHPECPTYFVSTGNDETKIEACDDCWRLVPDSKRIYDYDAAELPEAQRKLGAELAGPWPGSSAHVRKVASGVISLAMQHATEPHRMRSSSARALAEAKGLLESDPAEAARKALESLKHSVGVTGRAYVEAKKHVSALSD